MPNESNKDEFYKVKLDHIFEGPMDLLIYLIKKNEVDIYDIPVALITDQYLAYLEWMQSMNIDFAGDFLVMAATLGHIKSRMLLPVHDDQDDEEDPRLEVTRPLLEYLQMKSAAEMLLERNLLGKDTFTRPAAPDDDARIPVRDDTIHIGLFELIDAFQNILKSISPEHRIDMTTDGISVKEKISELVDILEAHGDVTFDQLFAAGSDRQTVITTFLAVLEMARLNLIRIFQHVPSGIIRIFYT
ncbi:MAG: segregation/condensation protein A [Desulfobacterales bacterium]|nr:segregation/condensation protein A [Desulfobacterales bacterium]MDD4392170.1 segregation/condensation protein A [Desulfobacterales bacterium]